MTRRSYSGSAYATTLNTGITNVATSLTVLDATNLPTGASGPFVLTIDAGLASEEKVLVASRALTTCSGLTRGYDGTSAVAHNAGASVRHTLSAVDLDEANAHVNATTGVHGVSGSVVGTTSVQTLTNKTFSGPIFTGVVVGTPLPVSFSWEGAGVLTVGSRRRWVAPVAGTAYGSYGVISTAGTVTYNLYKNGTLLTGTASPSVSLTAGPVGVFDFTDFTFAAGDLIEVNVSAVSDAAQANLSVNMLIVTS